MSNRKGSTTKQLLRQFDKKLDLPDHWLKVFLKNGFFYGSYVYGGFDRENSDIDLAIHPRLYDQFDRLLAEGYGFYENASYREKEDFVNLYVKHNGYLMNLSFFYEEKTYFAYKEATDAMVAIHKANTLKSKMKDKIFRVNLFEFLVHELLMYPDNRMNHIADDIPF